MATPSRSHLHALFSLKRRTSNATALPTITDIAKSSNNLAAASEFNLFFTMMNPNSTCNLKINTQAIVCINEQIATCDSAGKYELQACPNGLKCRAVPLDAGRIGLSIQCVPTDGANMAQLTSRSNAPASASLMEKNSTSLRREPSPTSITNTKIAASSPSGNKLNNITKTTLHTSAKTQQVIAKTSHASSTAVFPSATVPTTTTTSVENNPKSKTAVLRILPVIRGSKASQ